MAAPDDASVGGTASVAPGVTAGVVDTGPFVDSGGGCALSPTRWAGEISTVGWGTAAVVEFGGTARAVTEGAAGEEMADSSPILESCGLGSGFDGARSVGPEASASFISISIGAMGTGLGGETFRLSASASGTICIGSLPPVVSFSVAGKAGDLVASSSRAGERSSGFTKAKSRACGRSLCFRSSIDCWKRLCASGIRRDLPDLEATGVEGVGTAGGGGTLTSV